MNIPAFKAELLALLATTANLTAAEKTKLRNRFVSEYQNEWDARVAAGTVDNAANRGQFAIDKTVNGYWGDIYKAGSSRENQAAVPEPEVLS
jgi:hypothetical protein